MAFMVIVLLAVIGGVMAGEHFHSYIVGFGVASVAVGSCYWLSFRTSKYPQLALLLLISGFVAKLGVTVFGVMWSLERELITSPIVFALSYLFFSIVTTYGYFRYREYWMSRIDAFKAQLSAA